MPAPAPRLAPLDLLRGVAILLVMGRHMYVTELWHRIGWFGVQLFFVLSGFLVSGLLFREYHLHGRLDLRRFLIRRAFKIYPGFLCFLLVTLSLGHFSPAPPTAPQIASELLFFQSYVPGYWQHTWSLSVEEHFYVLLTLAMLLATRRPTGDPFRSVPAVTLLIGLLCLAARASTAARLPFDVQTHLFPTHLRLDALAFGACLAYWHQFRATEWSAFHQRHRSRLLAFAVLALAPLTVADLRAHPLMFTLGLTTSYLGTGALLVCLLAPDNPLGAAYGKQAPPFRFLCWLGRNSYAIYLWHMAVAVWGVGKIKTLLAPQLPYPAELLLYFGLSVALGAAATRLAEQPLLRLRDRWYPSRAAQSGSQPSATRTGMQVG